MKRLSWRGGARRNSNMSGASGASQSGATEDPSSIARARTASITDAMRGHKRTSSESVLGTDAGGGTNRGAGRAGNGGGVNNNKGEPSATESVKSLKGGSASSGGSQPSSVVSGAINNAGRVDLLRRPEQLSLSVAPRAASSAPESASLSPRLDLSSITGSGGGGGGGVNALNSSSALTISMISGAGANSGSSTFDDLSGDVLDESSTMETDAAALGVTNLLSVRHNARHDKEIKEATEIKPWLYLGGDEVAKSKKILREKRITHVLNAAHAVCENYHEGDEDFEYVRPMDLADDASESIGHFLLQAIADIERVRESGGKILVHCHLGASRSATLVIAYLMWYDKLSSAEALKLVKAKRSIVQPNLGFILQLKDFDTRLM